MDVGVRELKQHLSEYLARVERGETIRVTDRGVPKAQISPLPGTGRMDQGINEGWIRPGSGTGFRPCRRWPSTGTVSDVLADDRTE